MKPLIDGDLVAYEIAFGCQKMVNGELELVSVQEVNERVKRKIDDICAAVYATEPPIIYLTGKTNFRNDIAKSKEYKGQRKHKPKPHYLKYIRAVLMAEYDWQITEGLEADDLMAIHQTSRLKYKDTIICTRDKDLRQVPGMHYGWECAKQPSFGPKAVDEFGELYLRGRTLKGTGKMLLYAQMLMGDSTDNIGGAKGWGDEKTYHLLKDCADEEALYNAVKTVYDELYEDEATTRLAETANLVFMIRELNNGIPVMWRAPV